MKKYTKRLRLDLHNYRVAKNYVAAAIVIGTAVKTLAVSSTLLPVIGAALVGGTIVILGETLFNIGMSWVETCESIQEKENEVI